MDALRQEVQLHRIRVVAGAQSRDNRDDLRTVGIDVEMLLAAHHFGNFQICGDAAMLQLYMDGA